MENQKTEQTLEPAIKDLGTATDLINGLGAGKEPGGFDGDFAPLQIS